MLICFKSTNFRFYELTKMLKQTSVKYKKNFNWISADRKKIRVFYEEAQDSTYLIFGANLISEK